ncbi:HET-domain-containing protein [Xylariaceae sp. FL0016]|nr:HET-domain-containing protein [Xylariaceae sp. FL0016]
MPPRLCERCSAIFSGQPDLRKEIPHTSSLDDLQQASKNGCYICRTISSSDAVRLLGSSAPFESLSYIVPLNGRHEGWYKLTIDAALSDEEIDRLHMEGNLSDSDDDDSDLSASQPGSDAPEGDFNRPPVLMWGFYLMPANNVENLLADGSPTVMELKSPELLGLARKWLSTCSSTHPKCKVKNSAYRPTRLIEISNDKQVVRLVVTKDHASIDSYATLSHCWGKAKTLKLLDSNIKELQAGIRTESLPTSYKEAIVVCQALDIRYIWIDSLCIVQDSKEDWKREALTMKDVYQNSILNVAAAAAAENSDASFAKRDPQLIAPVEVTTQWEGEDPKKHYLMSAETYAAEVELSPLRQRAWVIQEVWLAGRNLYLTSGQLWWECRELEACEAFPRGMPPELLSPDWLNSHKPSVDDECEWGKLSFVHKRWDELVQTYTACRLTFPSDKIIAFAGIAQNFQDVILQDEYNAGLWRSQLPEALCWVSERGRWAYRPQPYQAPSWSWASIEGPISFSREMELAEEGSTTTVAKLLRVTTVAADGLRTATLKGSRIELEGHLSPVGINEGRITVDKGDGSFGFIDGSLDHLPTLNRSDGVWTAVELDENTKGGEPSFSYIDQFSAADLSQSVLEGSTRVTKSWQEWDMDLYSLPVITWRQHGKLWSEGLILCRVDIESQTVYQRVGSFTTSGELTTLRLLESPKQDILII